MKYQIIFENKATIFRFDKLDSNGTIVYTPIAVKDKSTVVTVEADNDDEVARLTQEKVIEGIAVCEKSPQNNK